MTNLIQANLELMGLVAADVAAGTSPPLIAGVNRLAVVYSIDKADKGLASVPAPQPLGATWASALSIHNQTKTIMARWFRQEIVSTEVIEEITPLREEMANVAAEMDRVLVETYGFDAADVAAEREELLASLPDFFATPTPTAPAP